MEGNNTTDIGDVVLSLLRPLTVRVTHDGQGVGSVLVRAPMNLSGGGPWIAGTTDAAGVGWGSSRGGSHLPGPPTYRKRGSSGPN